MSEPYGSEPRTRPASVLQRARRVASALLGRPTPMISPDMDRYADEFSSPEPELLRTVAAETQLRTEYPGMMSDARQAHLLATLVHLGSTKNVLEIGTFTGYSALAIAAALPEDGQLVTCEVDPTHAEIAARHFAASALGDRINLRTGPALITVASLAGPFDLIFIDADKESYVQYFEATLPKLAPSGVMVVDNTLHAGLQAEDDGDRLMIDAIKKFNRYVRDDPRVDQVILTIRDGVTIIRHHSA